MKEVTEVQAEGRALYAALSIVEGKNDLRAKRDIEAFRRNFTPEDSIEGLAKSAALMILCGEPLESLRSSWEPQNDYEVLCSLWTAWAMQRSTAEVPLLQHNFGGSLERLVLQQWKSALEALFSEDRQTAQKLYRRATLLGSEYGAQSHLTIQWTYVATFIPASIPAAIPMISH